MYSFQEQYKTIKSVILRNNSSKRINRPFCGGYETLSLSKLQGRLLWNFFKASCKAKGVKDTKLSIHLNKGRLSSGKPIFKKSNPKEIPSIFLKLGTNPSLYGI